MASAEIARDIAAVGTTTPIEISESTLYIVEVVLTGGAVAGVLPEFSVDGENFFSLNPVPPNRSYVNGIRVYQVEDMPSKKIRLNVTSLPEGTTVTAHIVTFGV